MMAFVSLHKAELYQNIHFLCSRLTVSADATIGRGMFSVGIYYRGWGMLLNITWSTLSFILLCLVTKDVHQAIG